MRRALLGESIQVYAKVLANRASNLHPFGFAKRDKDLNTASQNAHTLKGQQTLRPKNPF